jgi:nitrate reductase NapAB chaperone NapD
MIIQSYLAFAGDRQIARLSADLAAIEGCEVFPADNDENVLVLVTEADDDTAQKQLESRLEAVAGLGCLAMVGGWTE